MLLEGARPPTDVRCVSLVDGESNVRHARQLMFRSAGYNVCAYASFTMFLADPDVLCCDCIVADAEGADTGEVELLRSMREAGWRGSAILIADEISAELAVALKAATFVAMLPKAPSDRVLLVAVDAAISRYRSRDQTPVTV